MLYQANFLSPLGEMLLLSSEEALLGVWFKDQKHMGSHYDFSVISNEYSPINQQTTQWLTRYFTGEMPSSDELPLKPEVSDYRRRVLTILQKIPYGQVTTYKDIAIQLAEQTKKQTHSARAVGGAVGHNPISIIIPCHRVIGSDGSLTGFAGGLQRKKALLRLEGVDF